MIVWAWTMAALGSPDCVALDRAQPPLEGAAGSRKIALVVGVGDYEARPDGRSIDLEGPPNDALRVRNTLVEQYGFPSGNVCMLRDGEATRDAFFDAWEQHLGRAQSGDTVVYYFAGHGSQTKDHDGPRDETDGLDETFLLHDSRTSRHPGDLIDDELNGLLADLYAKTENITVLVDACNSGTATRQVVADVAVERKVPPPPARVQERIAPQGGSGSDGSGGFSPDRFPGMVIVTAAQDGTSALERNGQGVFTNALLRALEGRGHGSWEQLMQTIPRWIAAQRSYQVATFEGRLDRRVFGSTVVQRDLSWTVTKVSDQTVSFRGPSLPGFTEGAVLRIFEDGTTKHKARVRLSSAGAMTARGDLISGRRATVVPGDFAVLESPGADSVAITVQLADGVPLEREIRKALKSDKILARTVRIVDTAADFYLKPGPRGEVDIWGAEGVRRNRLPGRNESDAFNVASTLGLHARQIGLIELSAEPNDVYPEEMIELHVTPMDTSEGCFRTRYEDSAMPVAYVQVPMCNAVQIEATLVGQPRRDLYLGILYLANDGSIEVWPRAGTVEVLRQQGDTHVEPLGWVSPPLHAPDRILVFGTHEPVSWNKLGAKAVRDMAQTRGGTLNQFIADHVAGTRGIDDEAPGSLSDTAFTSSFIQLEVVADETKWTDEERTTPGTCRALRERSCRR